MNQEAPSGAPVVLVIGLPGTGKLTVARELVSWLESHGQTVRLVDNHYVNNVVFHLLPVDGVSPLPEEVWDRVGEVRSAVFQTIERLSPADWSFVFTVHIGEGDEDFVDSVARLARARGSTFVPVRLLCDLEELERRVTAPGRHEQLKSVSVEEVRRDFFERPVPEIEHPNTVTVDVTHSPPSEAAVVILERLDAVQ